MKKIFIFIMCLAMFVFAGNCKDWRNNSDNCLYDTTYQRPKYSNTETYMQNGESACRTYSDQYYTFLDSVHLDNGLYINVKLPRRICRKIENIAIIKIPHTIHIPKKKIDRSCCIRQACVGCSPDFIRNEIDQCYHGEWHAATCSRTYYIDSTYYTHAYQVKYSDSAEISFDFSKYHLAYIELDKSYYVDNESIEIYRTNGTLRYKGELTYIPGDLENRPTYKTRGWCYNKTGTKELRKTNNVDLCK